MIRSVDNDDRQLILLMAETWDSVGVLMESLSSEEWLLPSDCPGWTVKDCFSHLIGIESRLLGRQISEFTLESEDLLYVRNELGMKNQIDVVLRRSVSSENLIKEYMSVTSARLDMLKHGYSMTEKRESPDGRVVDGRELISVRILDCWVHEQDIRRATGKIGNLTGDSAAHVFDRLYKTLPFILGKRVKLADGSTAKFIFQGDDSEIISFGSHAGRARKIENPDNPSVELIMDHEIYLLLSCGRISPDKAVISDRVEIIGDQDLGSSILSHMNFIP